MATLQKPFQFLFPVTHLYRLAGALKVAHKGDLLVIGKATCRLTVGPVCDEIAYHAELTAILSGGSDILPMLRLQSDELLADVQSAANAHAAFVFNYSDQGAPNVRSLDPAECFRAGAGSFASAVLSELDAGKDASDVRAMCHETIEMAKSTGYWKAA